jgi:prepilin-type N-terminal cleavage/methylation domain-containing protein
MQRAFTLIELLVVVTIIVVLMALLAPAIDKAVEAAVRVKCAANLHAWGVAVPQHYMDHRRKLLKVSLHSVNDPDRGALPSYPFYRKRDASDDEFTLDEIAPYVQGPNGPNGQAEYVGKLWYCPASLDSFWYAGQHDKAAREETVTGGVQVGFMYNDYAYFGQLGRGLLSHHATRPEQLVGSRPEPGRLMMADTVYRWNVESGAWSFNHSEVGFSVHTNPSGRDMVWKNLPPPITGVNQLFGDGGVSWKEGDRFNPQAMHDRLPTEAYVSEGGDGNAISNLHFY